MVMVRPLAAASAGRWVGLLSLPCPCAASAALERTRGHHQPVLSRAPHHLVVEQTARSSILLLLAIWKSFSNLSQVAKLQMMKLAVVELEHFSES